MLIIDPIGINHHAYGFLEVQNELQLTAIALYIRRKEGSLHHLQLRNDSTAYIFMVSPLKRAPTHWQNSECSGLLIRNERNTLVFPIISIIVISYIGDAPTKISASLLLTTCCPLHCSIRGTSDQPGTPFGHMIPCRKIVPHV